MALEQSNEGSNMPARKSYERTRGYPQRAQALISDDPEQSLGKLASIVGVSEPTCINLPKKIFDTNRTH